eukprot:scaffold205821_cov24-Prasinocladus_malaysianus.AAC.2
METSRLLKPYVALLQHRRTLPIYKCNITGSHELIAHASEHRPTRLTYLLLLQTRPNVNPLPPLPGSLVQALELSNSPAAVAGLVEVPAQPAVRTVVVACVGRLQQYFSRRREANRLVWPPIPKRPVVRMGLEIAVGVILRNLLTLAERAERGFVGSLERRADKQPLACCREVGYLGCMVVWLVVPQRPVVQTRHRKAVQDAFTQLQGAQLDPDWERPAADLAVVQLYRQPQQLGAFCPVDDVAQPVCAASAVPHRRLKLY